MTVNVGTTKLCGADEKQPASCLHFPFLLRPAAKDYLWGGQRLNEDYAKNIDLDPLAETWECSTHPDGPSVVASGPLAGQTLRQVLEAHPEFLGSHPQKLIPAGEGLPVLIKFIDASRDLSVQVHPSDDYARVHENGSLGKSEMWYVLDARPGAQLVYGFRGRMSPEQVRRSISDGTITKYLQYVPVHRGDVFFIRAGTVHAIGAGILIAEIQESSNLTYRLYDYDRVDKNGQKRPLHLDKALAVANLGPSPEPRQPMRVLRYRPGYASELLVRCKYFQTERVLINTERVRSMASLQTGHNSFMVFLCIDGCADLFGEGPDAENIEKPGGTASPENDRKVDSRGSSKLNACDSTRTLINIFRGDCIFIPADSIPLRLHGKAEFLKITC